MLASIVARIRSVGSDGEGRQPAHVYRGADPSLGAPQLEPVYSGSNSVVSRVVRGALARVARRLPLTTIRNPISGEPYLDRYYVAGGTAALRNFPADTRKRLGWLPFTVYLHHIRRPDWTTDLHSHPWSAVSVILAGGYLEERLHGNPHSDNFRIVSRWRSPWSIARILRDDFHRISAIDGESTWTLMVVGKKSPSWLFFNPNLPRLYEWSNYLDDPTAWNGGLAR